MNNISGRLNRKIELWQNVQTEEKNSIGQKKWEETKVKAVWAGSETTNREPVKRKSRRKHVVPHDS